MPPNLTSLMATMTPQQQAALLSLQHQRAANGQIPGVMPGLGNMGMHNMDMLHGFPQHGGANPGMGGNGVN